MYINTNNKQKKLFDIPTIANKAKNPYLGKNVGGENKMEGKIEGGFSVDFSGEGKAFKKPFVEPDSYEATVLNVSDIFVTKNPISGEDEAKLSVTFELDGAQDDEGKPARLPYYLRAKIVHSAKKAGFSDSKLYTLLEKAGKLESCKQYWATINSEPLRDQMLAQWLKTELLGERAKVVTKTIVPKSGGEKYSVVSEVLKFIRDSVPEHQEELVA